MSSEPNFPLHSLQTSLRLSFSLSLSFSDFGDWASLLHSLRQFIPVLCRANERAHVPCSSCKFYPILTATMDQLQLLLMLHHDKLLTQWEDFFFFITTDPSRLDSSVLMSKETALKSLHVPLRTRGSWLFWFCTLPRSLSVSSMWILFQKRWEILFFSRGGFPTL